MRRVLSHLVTSLIPLIIGGCFGDSSEDERDSLELAGILEESMTIAVNTDVFVQENLTVPAGVELVAEQGVHFLVSESGLISIDGRLVTNGTSSNQVKLYPVTDTFEWYGIISTLNDTLPSLELNYTSIQGCIQGISIYGDNAQLENVTICNCSSYGLICAGDSGTLITNLEVYDCVTGVSLESMSTAQHTDAWLHDNEIGIWTNNTHAILDFSRVQNNSTNGIRCDSDIDSLQIRNNSITGNDIGIIYRYTPYVTLVGNTIANNERGIYLISFHRHFLVIQENNILDNEQFAISFEVAVGTPRTLDISNNYWGTTDSTEIAEAIIDAYDIPGWDTLRFVPFAMEPF